MRDLPAVSSAIIWARQIERQLLTYMKRVEDVLGKGWESYAEGHRLQVESASFRAKLDTKPLYDAWIAEITRRGDLTINGRLFDVVRTRATATNAQGQLQLVVQFDPQVIALFKEVRALIWLGYPVPLTISHRAKDAKRVYPHAVSLMESVRTFTQTLDVIDSNPDVAVLLASYRSHAQQMISKGKFDDGFGMAADSRHEYAVGSSGSRLRRTSFPSRDIRWSRKPALRLRARICKRGVFAPGQSNCTRRDFDRYHSGYRRPPTLRLHFGGVLRSLGSGPKDGSLPYNMAVTDSRSITSISKTTAISMHGSPP